MTARVNILKSFIAALLLAGACHAATITGTVKGADGVAFQGAFVEAQNTKSRITTIVLSDSGGRYLIPNLPVGDYRVQIKAIGFRAEPRSGVALSADQQASFDFALQKAPVRWNEISFNQAMQLWPAGKGKDLLAAHCSICHEFQTRMASVTRDADGWADRVAFMRQAMHFSIFLGPNLTDQDASDVAAYLTSLFGPDSVLPKSPADLPGYQKTVRPFSSVAMNIVYVEYEMPGPSRMPFSAAPDKNGNIWIPDFGVANKITRLDPKTGEMQDFSVPFNGTAGIHSAVPAPDGSVWLAEQGSNRVGKWNPATQKITEFQDAYVAGKEGIEDGGSKHTVRIDRAGKVWVSGVPLVRFDPETEKFTRFIEGEYAYDVKPESNGDAWFTGPLVNKIGKVDGKTLKVTQWTPPTANSFPRRMEIAADGTIWFGEFNSGKMGRFDPKMQTFKEYQLPGPDPSPYALGIDSDGYIWYDAHYMDEIGRFDPRTGKTVEYPFPHSEIVMREFFRDAQGRMWYGSAPNNKVGYFYLAGKSGSAYSSTK
ncbi:MAG TPA: carboxypeptidase regulatory-like domain-containing protein [Candidatus Acidoferrales bacterium]|jgi:virginiamycin B lyase|nr:carboxypeptidase regulatory-like domain-containing protein [Candidatus Acidoferrales bacterium]